MTSLKILRSSSKLSKGILVCKRIFSSISKVFWLFSQGNWSSHKKKLHLQACILNNQVLQYAVTFGVWCPKSVGMIPIVLSFLSWVFYHPSSLIYWYHTSKHVPSISWISTNIHFCHLKVAPMEWVIEIYYQVAWWYIVGSAQTHQPFLSDFLIQSNLLCNRPIENNWYSSQIMLMYANVTSFLQWYVFEYKDDCQCHLNEVSSNWLCIHDILCYEKNLSCLLFHFVLNICNKRPSGNTSFVLCSTTISLFERPFIKVRKLKVKQQTNWSINMSSDEECIHIFNQFLWQK